MQYNADFIKKWEDIINDVNTTDIPLECIKKAVIKFQGRGQKTINFNTLRKQGLDWEEIEQVITRVMEEAGSSIRNVEFVVDITAVAEIVQQIGRAHV